MAAPSTYRHFCPTARALELVGERWSLLVVRDLLAGEQRFTDLSRSLAGITPKLLTQRLRELEEGEVVERDQVPGRREVWYRLTESGRALAPVVEALTVWGIEHAGRAPQQGESVHPRHVMDAYVAVLNRHRRNTALPHYWNVRFPSGDTYTLVGDGNRWWSALGETPGAALIETTPEAWATFLDASPENALMLAERVGPADEDAPLHAKATTRSAPRKRRTNA